MIHLGFRNQKSFLWTHPIKPQLRKSNFLEYIVKWNDDILKLIFTKANVSINDDEQYGEGKFLGRTRMSGISCSSIVWLFVPRTDQAQEGHWTHSHGFGVGDDGLIPG